MRGGGKWEVGSGKWEVGSGKWEVGSGKSPDPSHPLPESVTEDFMTKIVKRRFHFS